MDRRIYPIEGKEHFNLDEKHKKEVMKMANKKKILEGRRDFLKIKSQFLDKNKSPIWFLIMDLILFTTPFWR